MKIIKNKVTKSLLFASIFTIPIIFNSSKVLASGELLPPKGYIETPSNGTTINGESVVKGWFLDGSGVSKIEVLVDGKSMGVAQYGNARLDVQKAFPQYQNANSGYQYTLNSKTLTYGQHSLTVRETENNGKTIDLKSQLVNVQNLPAKGTIDTPTVATTIKGESVIKGWFLDGSGVSKIEVLVDGKSAGLAQYGSTRLDVQKAYPQYQNANSGYQYTLNTNNLTNGQHLLTVRETGKNGATNVLQSQMVNVQNLLSRGSIDTPAVGSTIKGESTIRGWFLDVSDVFKVEVLIDGKTMGQAQYGSTRLDVQKVYPEYQNASSGYQYTLNTMNLTNGQHSLTVRETGNNGTTKVLQSQMVNVQNLPAKGSLDTPAAGSTISGDSNVRGWFLDGSGVSKVEVLVDGKITGTAQYGSTRLDVANVYPNYQNTSSGYQYTLNTRNLTNGQHSLTIRETGNNGATNVLQSQMVNVQNLPAKGSLDTPANGALIKGDSVVTGWFLDGSGVSKVEVLVDGNTIGAAQVGSTRLDVSAVYPDYHNDASGYQYTLDTKQFADGPHTLAVKETGANGSTYTLTYNVTVGNGNLYTLVDLKKPANITANDIVNFINQKHPDSPLKQYAQSFIDAQVKYGVNAQYLVAHTIWETGWGGSDLITYKHNLYGYGAFDVCPFTCGYYFPSVADSINKVAYQVRHDYLDSSGTYYVSSYGPTLVGMNVHYATDPNWENGIASLMATMKPYDYSYYSNTKELVPSGSTPPSYGSDIPDGQDYPKDTILNFPSGITAKVNNSTLNLRSIPYVSPSSFLRTLSLNTVVNVVGLNTDVEFDPNSNGNYVYHWFRVNVNDQNGWLYGQSLDIDNLLQVNTSTGSLQILSSPSTDSTSTLLTSVTNGTYLKLVMNNGNPFTNNGWYNVYLPNSATTGWVSGANVKQIIH
ncbi:Ig-like domain-containing protein [Neobacillus pocheonensis]|uniref:Ig-like domain-containing protein n=1 Tax=Neobacillus pocheonensis TaxID=363869 RepID=A0ABT0WC51_9BACI|nr:Ig-like domain-containing protein [Neobacillus pocheonensis]